MKWDKYYAENIKNSLITNHYYIGYIWSNYYNFEFMPYMLLSLGALMLFIGIVEIQRQRKAYWGYIIIVVSLFVVYVAIKGFLLH